MNSSKSIEILYKVISEIKSPAEAKTFISEIVFNVIDDLQSDGAPITEKEIEKRLSSIANDFQNALKNKNNVA